MKPVFRLFSLMIAASSLAIASAEDAWPSFQNGGRQAVVSGSLTPESQIQWAVELTGYGQSSPVVWQDHVYVTTVDGANKDMCLVTAFRLHDGSQLWQHSVPNATPQESNNYVSKAAPTPATDELGVVCLFEGGNVVALTHDGQLRWERNLVEVYGPVASRHGLSASVEQTSDNVFLWIERAEDPYVLCVNKESGKTIWKSPGVGATSWASPRLVPVENGHHLVLSASGFLVGLDPADGKQLWKLEGINGNSTPTPLPLGEGRFLIGATAGRGEDGRGAGGKSAESNGVVQIQKASDGSWSAAYLWKAKRATSSFASPTVHDNVALFVNREGVLYGLDMQSGEEMFAKRLSGSSWATAIGLADGGILVPARDGKLDVVRDLRGELSITTINPLPDPAAEKQPAAAGSGGSPPTESGAVLYSAVFAGDSLLLRQGATLSSIPVSLNNSSK